ncbi:hypothetical protein Q8A67_023725 [Cirrhinus molitorella]|uniref:C-type lectin domain-containing protein n=1 Tax=Cirrhinus molitorella TaxID=172907 RepID=A0AA88P6K9_9TELE|nr:hypothetical protein Q8A67_023725 [Cirrhinus molitorella]
MERKNIGEKITDANRDARNRHHVRTETQNSDTKRHQSSRHTGSESVKIRNYRAAVVCLVLMCVLLLTAVIVLGVDLHNLIEDFYTKNKNLTKEIEELQKRESKLNNNITELSKKNETLFKENEKLQKKMEDLWQQISKMDRWKCHQSSLYYVSSEKKNWTESRRDCRERGADLIILNDKQEQEFAKTLSHSNEFWTGLTDTDVEGTCKWVDGSTQTPE